MKIDERKKVIAINAFLIAALFGLVSLNKEILRPASQDSVFLSSLTGCFPNFIAAYIISTAFVSASIVRRMRRARLLVYAGSFIVFLVLTIEEIKPMWGASTYFDPLDIIASGAGSLLAVITFEVLKKVINKPDTETR